MTTFDNSTLWDVIAVLEDSSDGVYPITEEAKKGLRQKANELKRLTTDTRLPSEWERYTGITIIDPDGWDRKNFDVSWNTPITYSEWEDRSNRSTISLRKFLERTLF